MELKPITKNLAVSPQIAPGDVGEIMQSGYRSIIVNRPDGEAADQPTYDEIDAACKAVGLETRYVPVQTGMVTEENIAEFAQALRQLPEPVLAYCRSGMRSAMLWSLVQAGTMPVNEILAATRAAGFELSGLAGRINNRAETAVGIS